MLLLSRKVGQSIDIGNGICVTVTEINGNRATIGIAAPSDVAVHRHEVTERIEREGPRRNNTPLPPAPESIVEFVNHSIVEEK